MKLQRNKDYHIEYSLPQHQTFTSAKLTENYDSDDSVAYGEILKQLLHGKRFETFEFQNR
jgi:hypothetical protein